MTRVPPGSLRLRGHSRAAGTLTAWTRRRRPDPALASRGEDVMTAMTTIALPNAGTAAGRVLTEPWRLITPRPHRVRQLGRSDSAPRCE
jgi:hypothetical protein